MNLNSKRNLEIIFNLCNKSINIVLINLREISL